MLLGINTIWDDMMTTQPNISSLVEEDTEELILRQDLFGNDLVGFPKDTQAFNKYCQEIGGKVLETDEGSYVFQYENGIETQETNTPIHAAQIAAFEIGGEIYDNFPVFE